MATSSRAKPAPLGAEQRALVAQRVLRARVRLALAQPFLATSVMRLPVREVAGMAWCPTAATDGYHIFYNPDWMARLNDAELRGLLAHEVLHVLFDHADRRRERDPKGWNIACDFAINLLLIGQGFKLPAGGLMTREFAGMTAEQIYGELRAKAKSQPKPPANGTSAPPDDEDGASLADGGALPNIGADLLDADDPNVRPMRSADAPDAEKLDELRRELREDATARLQGQGAAGFKQECDADDARRIDWRALLRAWLNDRIKGDWTSYPFSKKHIHRGLFMPSAGMAVPGHVVFAIDTSGSMDTDTLGKIVGELRAFRETFPCQLTVLQADADVQEVTRFDAMDGTEIPTRLQVVGRGGTDFRPVFEWVQREAEGAIVLYATDGFGTFPQTAPSSPVIWLFTPPHAAPERAPFGAVVKLD